MAEDSLPGRRICTPCRPGRPYQGQAEKSPSPDGHAAAKAAASWEKGWRSPEGRNSNDSPGSNHCSGSPDRSVHPVAGENADAIAASNAKSFFAWRSSGSFSCAGQKCRLSRCGTSVKYRYIMLIIKKKKISFRKTEKGSKKCLPDGR